MLFHITIGLFFFSSIALSEANFVESLSKSKCSIRDGACQGDLVTSSLKAIHKTGVPELDIPQLDPYHFENISISILDLIVLYADEGSLKGLKNCVVDEFKTDIDQRHSEMKMTCHSLSVKAKYRVAGSSPILKNLLGGESIQGDGNGKVKVEKLQLHFDYFYDMERNKDGEVYFKCKFNQTVYDFKFLGRVSFAADNIRLGNQDATSLIIDFLNQNDQFVMSTFGRIFMDKVMEFVYLHTNRFFREVPAKNFIIEDLSEYVKS